MRKECVEYRIELNAMLMTADTKSQHYQAPHYESRGSAKSCISTVYNVTSREKFQIEMYTSLDKSYTDGIFTLEPRQTLSIDNHCNVTTVFLLKLIKY